MTTPYVMRVVIAAFAAMLLVLGNATPAVAATRTWSATVVLGSAATPAGPGEVLVEAIPQGQTTATASAWTGADGRVTFTLESDVAYSVRYTYSGTGLYSTKPQVGGIYTDNQYLVVPPMTTISGRVYLGSTSRAAAAGEVRVEAILAGTSYWEPVLTDATGAYTLRVDPRNDMWVRFTYVGDEPWSDGRTPSVVEVGSAPATGVDVILTPASVVVGHVTDSSGNAIAGATVTLDPVDALPDGSWPRYTVTTDASGAYRIGSIASTTYTLQVTAAGYVTSQYPGYPTGPTEVFDLREPQSIGALDVTMRRAGSLSGRITVQGATWWDFHDGAVTAELQSYRPDVGQWSTFWTDTVGEDGAYAFDGLQPHRYRVVASYKGQLGLAIRTSPAIDVGEDEAANWDSGTLVPGVSLVPGTLVKGSAPEVFLVDGTHTLVPIATFDSARDAGIPTTFQTVADTVLEPFDLADAPLSNKIRCNESDYLASGGDLHYAYEAQLPSVRSTELADSTCYKLTISTAPFNGFLSGKGTTWLVTQWATKRAILGSPVPASFPVNPWFLDQIYTGAPRVVGLVKFSDQPAVYLANGYERLIRIPSFESVSDLGLPTGFVTRPGGERAEYAIDDGVLGNAVRCGSSVYVGSGGVLWPITDRLAEGLPVTEVLGSVCARMPKRSTPISTALLVKSPTASMVYNVFAGTKEPVTSMEEATRLSSPEPVNFLTVRGSYLDLLPTVAERLTPGTLVKTASAPAVYLVDGETGLVPIASFESVSAAGLSTSYRVVSDQAVAARTIAKGPLGALLDCNGNLRLASDGAARPIPAATAVALPATLLAERTCSAMRLGEPLGAGVVLKARDAARIWVLTSGVLRPVTSMSSFRGLEGWYGALRTVDAGFVASAPKGAAIFPPKTLVKATDGPEVYVVDGLSRLIRIPSFDLAADLGTGPYWSPGSLVFESVPRADLSGYTVAGSTLTNVAACRGGTYFVADGGLHHVVPSLVEGLPITQLSDLTCRDAGTTPRTTALFVKSRSAATVFMLSDGEKRPVERWETVAEVSDPHPAVALAVNDAFLASRAVGDVVYPTASLVKVAGNPRVSVVDGPDRLVPLTSFESASAFGLATGVREVGQSAVDGYAVSDVSFDHLVQCGGRPWIGSGGRRWQLPEQSVAGLSATPLTGHLCGRLAEAYGSLTYPPFLKSSTSSTIYVLETGTKRPVTTYSALVAVADSQPIVWATVREAFLASIPTGPPIS